MTSSDGIYRGWIILAISIILFMVSTGAESSWGTMILCFRRDEDFLESSLAQLGSPLTVYFAFKTALSNLVFTALLRYGEFSLRQFAALGLSLMVTGLFLTSFGNGPQPVAVSFGIMFGTGCGLYLITTYLVIARWFPWTHRFHVFAASAMAVMIFLGASVMNSISLKMCKNPLLGWRWAFRVYAAAIGALGLLLVMVFGRPPAVTHAHQTSSTSNKQNVQKPPWSISSTFVVHGIWALAACGVGYAYYLPFVILPKHVTDLGYSEDEAEYVMMVLGIMGMIGQLVFSCVGDYVKGKLMLVNLIAISLVVVNNIVAAYSKTLAAVFMYSASVGCGVYLAVYFPVHNEIMDGENVATLFLTMRFSRGVGATAAPYIAGYIRDVTGSYRAAFLSVASSFGVFVLATLALICINKFRNLQSLDEEMQPVTGMSSR